MRENFLNVLKEMNGSIMNLMEDTADITSRSKYDARYDALIECKKNLGSIISMCDSPEYDVYLKAALILESRIDHSLNIMHAVKDLRIITEE